MSEATMVSRTAGDTGPFDRHATGLLVIDVQQGFDEIEASGVARNNPQAEQRIAALLAAFRARGMAIFHIRHEGTHAGSYFRPGTTGYRVKEEARELPGEPVIVKRVNSGFIGTDLEARLRAAGIRTLVVCGVTTNHCVETTTRMAGDFGFEVWLVRDATWAFERLGPDGERYSAEAVHAMSLANLHEEFARITMTTGVLGLLPAA